MSAAREQRIKFAFRIQSIKIIAATDMLAIDEDLRHRAPPACPLHHDFALGGICDNVDLLEGNALAAKKLFCPAAITTKRRTIDFDFGHV